MKLQETQKNHSPSLRFSSSVSSLVRMTRDSWSSFTSENRSKLMSKGVDVPNRSLVRTRDTRRLRLLDFDYQWQHAYLSFAFKLFLSIRQRDGRWIDRRNRQRNNLSVLRSTTRQTCDEASKDFLGIWLRLCIWSSIITPRILYLPLQQQPTIACKRLQTHLDPDPIPR